MDRHPAALGDGPDYDRVGPHPTALGNGSRFVHLLDCDRDLPSALDGIRQTLRSGRLRPFADGLSRRYPGLTHQVELSVTASSPEWARASSSRQNQKGRLATPLQTCCEVPDQPTGSGDRALRVLRYPANPRPANPRSIIAQVVGSGTPPLTSVKWDMEPTSPPVSVMSTRNFPPGNTPNSCSPMIARSGPTIEPSAFRPPLKRRPPALGTSKPMSDDE